MGSNKKEAYLGERNMAKKKGNNLNLKLKSKQKV